MMPDLAVFVPRHAGLGIFIINTDVQPPLSIFVKATMQESSSVLMAESAAAMALAAVLLKQLQSHQATLLLDNQQVVQMAPISPILQTGELSHIPRSLLLYYQKQTQWCAGSKRPKIRWLTL